MQTLTVSEKSKTATKPKSRQQPFFAPVRVQPKLSIGAVDDPYEREADAMADRVMRMPAQQNSSSNFDNSQTSFFSSKPKISPNVQPDIASNEREKIKSKEDNPEEEERLIHQDQKSFDGGLNIINNSVQQEYIDFKKEEKLQMKSKGDANTGMEAPSIVNEVINSGGEQLDINTRNFFEPRFGHDFSNVKIHTGAQATKSSQAINAHAYTLGNNIVFDSGKYQPHSDNGRRLLGHELTHVVQQGSAIFRRQEVKSIQKENISKSKSDVVRRGEAPVHRDIELTSLGVSDFTKANQLTLEQQAAAQVYAGNWMRDFSQFNVPKPIKVLAGMPKQIDLQGNAVANSGTIGEDGAQEIVYGIIRALAALEFGKDITDQLITKRNISAYRPQEHIDNPAGMTYSGDVVPQDMSPGDKIPSDASNPATNEYKGAAIAGNQLMNPALYSVSNTGLSEHIYNSIEFVKSQLREAMTAGATPIGRMRLGTGLHGIEDYFSHSNFIEVALNIIFSNSAEAKKLPDSLKALPSFKKGTPGIVDTLFDTTVTNRNKASRQAITTGTFGSTDTWVSISEVLLPMLPGLLAKIDMAIERAFSIVLSQQNNTTWQQIKKLLATDKGGAALVNLLDGVDASGLQLSSITIDKITIGDYWIASGFTPHFSKASEAIINMVNTIKDIKETRDTIKKLPEVLVPDAVLDFLKIIDQVIISMKDQIKVRIHETILSAAQQLTGIDARKGLQSGLQSLDKVAADQVEDLTKKSSLQSRLKDSDDDLNKLTTDEKSKVIPSGPLPPSHSEISKDHPDHPSAGGVRTKSLFFDLHRMLAIAADTHIMGLVETAWQKNNIAASILPSGPMKTDALSSEKLKHEAADISSIESINAPAEGRRFTQKENSNLGAEETATLNAVDLFISHPADTTWWIPIVESYAQAHTTELAEDIRLRNLTRAERQ